MIGFGIRDSLVHKSHDALFVYYLFMYVARACGVFVCV